MATAESFELGEYRIYFSCPRHGYMDIVASDEFEANEKAEEIMLGDDFEEEILMTDRFGEWIITQVERL